MSFEPLHDKTNKKTCVPSEDSDQTGHLPSLIRVFAVCMKKPWVVSYPLSSQRRLWLDWVDAQGELSLFWVHSHFVGFVVQQLIYALWTLLAVAEWASPIVTKWVSGLFYFFLTLDPFWICKDSFYGTHGLYGLKQTWSVLVCWYINVNDFRYTTNKQTYFYSWHSIVHYWTSQYIQQEDFFFFFFFHITWGYKFLSIQWLYCILWDTACAFEIWE